jgi:hypothetical protein
MTILATTTLIPTDFREHRADANDQCIGFHDLGRTQPERRHGVKPGCAFER